VSIFGRRIGPVTALMLLAPFMAEILSGASSPLVFVTFPPAILLDLGLYGCGAVLIREAAVRWGRGWPSILAMGVAFAVVEEGFVVSSFFDPLSPARQGFDASGTFGAGPDGSNWVWIPVLCIFHAVTAIALPILVAQLAYPSRARASWLSGRRLAGAAAWLIGAVALGRAMFSSGAFASGYYAHIAIWQVVASVAAIAGLVLLARYLPARIGPAVAPGRLPRPGRLAVLGGAAYAVYFMAGFGGPALGLSPAVVLVVVLADAILAAAALVRLSSRAGWSDRHRFAVPAGVAAFQVGMNLLSGIDAIVVGILAGYALYRAWRWLSASAAPPEEPPPVTPLTDIARRHEQRPGMPPQT
jgi:hypothetical protein